MRQRPNILFLFSDQQRWDTVGCYGQPLGAQLNLTPNLDALARRGVRFNHAFTCQPLCGPARSCLQTGVFATQSGCYDNAHACLAPDGRYLAHRLADAGYETAYIGKWHLAHGKSDRYAVPEPYRGGYRDHWLVSDVLELSSHGYEGYLYDKHNRRVDFEGYRVDCITDFVMDYLRDYAARAGDRPFFLMTSYLEPHHQNDLRRTIGPIGSKQRFAAYPVPGDLAGASPHAGAVSDWRRDLPDYLGCCASLDDNVGRVVALLEQLGLADNTVILYASDHGSHFCTRNAEYKRSCHEASIRVPLIAAGPGFTGGKVVDELVSLIDLPPTLLTIAGVDPPDHYMGRATQPLVAGDAADWPDDVYVQISESHIGRALRTKRWKYAVAASNPPGEGSPFADRYAEAFLYDLENDPHERNNLVRDGQHEKLRAQLAHRLKRRMAEAGEPEPAVTPAC